MWNSASGMSGRASRLAVAGRLLPTPRRTQRSNPAVLSVIVPRFIQALFCYFRHRISNVDFSRVRFSGQHMAQKILVSVAWPYANGPFHVGHLAGAYLPADIFARYQRLKGN